MINSIVDLKYSLIGGHSWSLWEHKSSWGKGTKAVCGILKTMPRRQKVYSYSWLEGKDMVANILTKLGSKRDGFDNIMMGNTLSNSLDEKNIVQFRGDHPTIFFQS